MMNNYQTFVQSKKLKFEPAGHKCMTELLKPFDFQKDIIRWAVTMGKACVFADTGLGKTNIQLHWAKDVARETKKPVLGLAPLAVARQTSKEAEKFEIPCKYVRSMDECTSEINYTNYEMLNHFDLSKFGGIVLDESSILKGMNGATRNQIIESTQCLPYRLACSATPAPNDLQELGNHCEFMGIMSFSEMRSMFFINDSGSTGSAWKLKAHAESEFWDFVASWAVMLSDPADLGYTEQSYELPPLKYHNVTVDMDDMHIFDNEILTLSGRNKIRRDSLESRCQATADIVNNSKDIHIVWCNLNDESKRLTELINGAVEISGSHDNEYKADMMLKFADGEIKCLVTKPLIAGMGLNFQKCHKQVFTGLSDSYEQFYQAVRRCWRFGQTNPVDVHIVTAQKEGDVVENILRKERQHNQMKKAMAKRVQNITLANLRGIEPQRTNYNPSQALIMPKFI